MKAHRHVSLAESLLQDVCFSLRMLAKNFGFIALAVLTLALGLAGNIVIFSVYNAFYLRPLPFVEPSRLVDLNESAPQWNADYLGLSYVHFSLWRRYNRSFEGMAAVGYEQYNVSFQGDATRVRGARVTHDLASVLGIQPILGRMFTSEEDKPGGVKVVLLGHGFWKRQFGGDEDVIGRTLRVNGEPYQIIGVLPPDDLVLVEREFWVPLAEDPNAGRGWMYSGVGRLKKGVTIDQAREDLMRVRRQILDNHLGDPRSLPKVTVLQERAFGNTRQLIAMMLAAVGLVLLIACANVAALMLARGLARSRELALRLSLGATRARLAQLIGIESLVVAGFGGLAGMLLGNWGLRLLLNSIVDQPPRWVSLDMDWRVWLFAGAMVLLSALLGAAPVIRSAAGLDLRQTTQPSAQQSAVAGGARRGLHALVVGEVALTLILLVMAGLLLKTFHAVKDADPGYRPDHLLVYEIALPENEYSSKEARMAFFREHLERVRGLRGVLGASAVSAPPLGGHWGMFFTTPTLLQKNAKEPDCIVLQRVALPNYLGTMGIPLVAGREFTEQDGINNGSRAVIVNETFARRFWPGQDPIGQQTGYWGDTDAPWMTVVGVARDVRHYGLAEPAAPGVYVPYAQSSPSQMAIVVRSSGEPTALVPTIRALVRQADPDLAVFGVVTMERRLSESLWLQRLTTSLFGIFAGVALVMALGAIYGVFSYVVSRRTPEIGVRLALGAQPFEVEWLVVRQGMMLTAIGMGIGTVGALMVAPVAGSLLYGVSPLDLSVLGAVALVLGGVAAVACWIPARRASKVDPIVALRCE